MANNDFKVDLNLSYTFAEDGSSQVIHKYTITNLGSSLAANTYEFDVLNSLPEDIQAYDQYGKLEMILLNTTQSTPKVLIPFSHLSVGKGKTNDFYLSYTGSTSSRVDGLWKVSIPIPATSQTVDHLSAQLIIPNTWGKLLSLNTQFATSSATSKSQIYKFDQDQLKTGNIYAVFGLKKVVGFEIQYNHNSSEDVIYLPSDNLHQNIFIQNITPQFDNILSDQNNVWFITFKNKIQSATVNGFALIDDGYSLSIPGKTNSSRISDLDSIPSSAKSEILISFNKPWQITPFNLFPSSIQIFNTGSQAIYHTPLTIKSSDLIVNPNSIPNIPVIPPFGRITVPISLTSSYYPSQQTHHINISAGNRNITYNLESKYFIIWYVFLVFFITIIIISIGKITHHTWGIYFQKQKAKSSTLRR